VCSRLLAVRAVPMVGPRALASAATDRARLLQSYDDARF